MQWMQWEFWIGIGWFIQQHRVYCNYIRSYYVLNYFYYVLIRDIFKQHLIVNKILNLEIVV